jgi:glycine oxidase
MLQLEGCPIRHALSCEDAYLVPRGDRTLVGSTIEHVGFATATTAAALETLRRAASAVVPGLATAQLHSAWAGLRPVTPDGRPIIGRDPDLPSVIYALGHGKNGVLLAPITAECVTSLVAGGTPPIDIECYGVERFFRSS